MGRTGRGPLRRSDPARELDEELAGHIRRRAAELEEAGGLPRGEALRRAQQEFGDLEYTRRYCRRQDRVRTGLGAVRQGLTALRDDGWAALRGLVRRPSLVAAPVAILAAAIALNVLVFSVVRGVLLAPLPFTDADRLFVAEEVSEVGGMSRASYPVLEAWRRQATTLDALSAYLDDSFTLVGEDGARRLQGAMVTEGFFGLLDRPLRMGRAFTAGDHRIGAAPTVIISEGLWHREFGADPGVLQQSLRLNGRSHAIVGVVRDAAVFPDGSEVWVPTEPSYPELLDVAGAKILVALGRIRPGVAPTEAARELGALSAGVAGGAPSATLTPLTDRLLGDVRTPLLLLQCAVLLVLLAACANAGGLLLAHSVRRRTALAIRASLGAGAGRLARALLAEGVLLGLGAGFLGVGLGAVLLRPVLGLVPAGLPRVANVSLDPLVVLVSLALAAATGVATTLVPALSGARTAPATLLREASGAAGNAPWLRRLLEGLVVGQVALAMLLTVGAGLLVRSFVATLRQDPGFDPSRVTVVDISLPDYRYPDDAARAAFARQLLERAAALPGARQAALGRNLPVSGSNMTSPLMVEGSAETTAAVQVAAVTDGYFDVLGIPLEQGTAFGDADRVDGPPVLIVDETVRTAEGRPLRVGDRAHSFFGTGGMRDVVGVAGPVRHAGLRSAPVPIAYEPFFQRGVTSGFALLVRSTAPAPSVARAARALVQDLDPELPVDRVSTMADRVSGSLAEPRFYTVGLSIFGGLALLLALAGCQAGLAHRVAARRREMGLRMALGASGRAVRAVVVRRGVGLTATGALVGIAAALPASRLLRSQLFGVTSSDPLSYVGLFVLLLAAGALASDVPARRAAAVDPAETLREV